VAGLFVPGWGATARLYAAGLPDGWEALELPAFRSTRGELRAYRRWLQAELVRRPAPVVLAGHSMGAALALLAAEERPDLVDELILVSPAGVPLAKALHASALEFVRQVARRSYPLSEVARMLGRVAVAPRAALRLAREVHELDLAGELERAGVRGVPCTVVACRSDELTTCERCRTLAAAVDADYREVDSPEGHIWPIVQPALLAAALSGAL
jgi:pimeloyl-ACP methyl ester carboxylesterase